MTNNLPAEYDRFAGGIVSFVTKSGTNHLHGALYEFIRNKVLNSNDYYSKQNHLPTPQFTQNQFGVNCGGPVVIPHLYDGKNKTFFFFSYDGFQASVTDTVPTAAMRQGDFSSTSSYQPVLYDPDTTTMVSPGVYTRQQFSQNKIPTSRFDAAVKVLMNYWGLPNVNVPVGTIANNWFGHVATGGNMDEFIARGDQNISDRQHAFIRYAQVKQKNLGVDPFGTHFYAGGYPGTNIRNQQAVIDDAYSFGPSSVLDFAVTPGSQGHDLSQLGPGWAALSPQLSRPTLPDMLVTDVSSTGGNGAIINTITDDFGLLPNFTFVKGRHSVKIGADLRLSRLNYGQVDVAAGEYLFTSDFTSAGPNTGNGGSGFASFLLGMLLVV
jgi:hypothetical protein